MPGSTSVTPDLLWHVPHLPHLEEQCAHCCVSCPAGRLTRGLTRPQNVVFRLVGLREHVKILGLQCFPDSSEAKGTPKGPAHQGTLEPLFGLPAFFTPWLCHGPDLAGPQICRAGTFCDSVMCDMDKNRHRRDPAPGCCCAWCLKEGTSSSGMRGLWAGGTLEGPISSPHLLNVVPLALFPKGQSSYVSGNWGQWEGSNL